MNPEPATNVSGMAARVFHSLDEVPRDFGPSIAAIGNFDGVHRGHQQILRTVAAEAQARGMRSIAITLQSAPGTIPLSPGGAEAAHVPARAVASAGRDRSRRHSRVAL